MTTTHSTWLQCTVSRTEPPRRLICFPHAGGSASFFRQWARHLPEVEVHAVRYPGRAERIDERPPTDLRALAGEIACALEPMADRPIALFGHSMGAVVALETARTLEARGVQPFHLFASGSRDGVSPVRTAAPDVADDDNTTIEQLVRLGGTDPKLAADPIFQELVLPYILSDGRMFHAYVMEPEPRLHCSVTTIVGDADADADQRGWSDLTLGEFCQQTLSGDHFYLVSDPPYALLRETLERQSVPDDR
ncbi:MAG: thioesterase II family protein [Acidimicrobiales bacterium]